MVCDNIMLLFCFYKTKRKGNNLFSCTKHTSHLDEMKRTWNDLFSCTKYLLFRWNGWTVLEQFITEYIKWPQNDLSLNKMIKNESALNKRSRTMSGEPVQSFCLSISRCWSRRWDASVPTGDASLYSAGESTGNRHYLWTSSLEQWDTWELSSESWCGHGVEVEHATAVVSLSSLICRLSNAFTATVIFVGWPELGSSLDVICLPVLL